MRISYWSSDVCSSDLPVSCTMPSKIYPQNSYIDENVLDSPLQKFLYTPMTSRKSSFFNRFGRLWNLVFHPYGWLPKTKIWTFIVFTILILTISHSLYRLEKSTFWETG